MNARLLEVDHDTPILLNILLFMRGSEFAASRQLDVPSEGDALIMQTTMLTIEDASSVAEQFAAEALQALYRRDPDLKARVDARFEQHALKDFAYHVRYFCSSGLKPDDEALLDYLSWLKVLFDGLGFSDAGMIMSFQSMADVSAAFFVAEHDVEFRRRCRFAVEHYPELGGDSNRYRTGKLADPSANAFLGALLAGKKDRALGMARSIVEDGASIRTLYMSIFEPCLREVGRLWHTGAISVAQEHYTTAAIQYIMSTFYERLFAGTVSNGRTVLAACAQGELHEMGLRMVADLLQADGWDTVYLGANLPVEALVSEACRIKPDIVALSATITANLPWVRAAISALRASGAAGSHILVGGLPFLVSAELWKDVGADAMAKNMADVNTVACSLVPGTAARQKGF